MKRTIVAASLVGLMGCASTQVIDSWKDPSVQGPIHFNQVVVLAMAPDESTRRVWEDQLVAKIGADRAVPSHSFLTMTDLKDVEKAKAAIQVKGADGVVMMRFLEKSQEVNYTPGSYTPVAGATLWGAGYSRGYMFDTGTVTTDTLLRLETSIYQVKDEKLLWSGVSETFNPSSMKTTADEVAEAVKKELLKEKLIEVKE